jgi:cell division protein FtsB
MTRIDEIEKLLREATPVKEIGHHLTGDSGHWATVRGLPIHSASLFNYFKIQDASLIANAPAYLRFLIDEVRRLEEKVERDIGSSAFDDVAAERDALKEQVERLENENRRLTRWKQETILVVKPIFDFAHPEMKLGESKVKFVLQLAKERDALKARVEKLEKALENYDNTFSQFNPDDKASRLEMRRAVIEARDAFSDKGEK